MDKKLNSIQESYNLMVSEATKASEPKFPKGTKVGIGSFGHDGLYRGIDSGLVHDIAKNGNHIVHHDIEKEHDFKGNLIPLKTLFAPNGHGVDHKSMIITSVGEHNDGIQNTSKVIERGIDFVY